MKEKIWQKNFQEKLRGFVNERDWEQFHHPKNLVLALVGEVGELVEHFTWLDQAEADKIMEGPVREAVEDELADVFIYLLRLTDVLGVDLEEVFEMKLEKNKKKYPVELCREWNFAKRSRLNLRT